MFVELKNFDIAEGIGGSEPISGPEFVEMEPLLPGELALSG
jgi:hypothetical protein